MSKLDLNTKIVTDIEQRFGKGAVYLGKDWVSKREELAEQYGYSRYKCSTHEASGVTLALYVPTAQMTEGSGMLTKIPAMPERFCLEERKKSDRFARLRRNKCLM